MPEVFRVAKGQTGEYYVARLALPKPFHIHINYFQKKTMDQQRKEERKVHLLIKRKYAKGMSWQETRKTLKKYAPEICERCKERAGEVNSKFRFESSQHQSTPPKHGDWVCLECEWHLKHEDEGVTK